jgi:hypothetical protein
MVGALNLLWAWLAAPFALAEPPYPPSPVIANVSWDFSTHRRAAAGSDNWPITWAADDHQYTSWGDGWGFDGGASKRSLGYSRIGGTKDDWKARDVLGSENAEAPATLGGKSYAILAVNGLLYSFVSPGSDASNLERAVLYRSSDGGRGWTATAVVFTAGTHGLALPCFLQFGKDYAGARDSSVYVYWTKIHRPAWDVQKPGEIMLTRVPRGEIETPGRYEFFAGFDGAGAPRWSTSPRAMRPVFTDTNGVMRNSANFDAGLGRYLLVTNHSAKNKGNIAIFDAARPWGPWTTVAYYTGWPTGREIERNAFYGNFASKWFSEDGLRFVFVFTGKGANDSWNSVEGRFRLRTAGTVPPAPRANHRAGR